MRGLAWPSSIHKTHCFGAASVFLHISILILAEFANYATARCNAKEMLIV